MGTREVIDIGNSVVCDFCNKDYTDSEESGGFLFGGNAVGPCCSESFLERVEAYNELDHIKGECPSDKSFADWIRDDVRGGRPGQIIIESF